MSEIWPLGVKSRSHPAAEPLRPFNCLMLMPFERRFDQVADVIKKTVLEMLTTDAVDPNAGFSGELPNIERLDWVTSSGVIQQEIWEKVLEADLVFCDLTGYNPNVMFEAGVCSAWKAITHVVFVKDHFFRQPSAFDIEPMRYTEYELTSEGIDTFKRNVAKLTAHVLIGFPDRKVGPASSELPIETTFEGNRDDPRIYTPPFAHRRVIDNRLEFGSLVSFAHSWALVGSAKVKNFRLEFTARFSNALADDSAWIGVGLRSQHYYANYSHLLYLTRDGRVVITEPDESIAGKFYRDIVLRPPTAIEITKNHTFRVTFDESMLRIKVDDFPKTLGVPQMKKVFGPGLVRLQASRTWMAVEKIRLSPLPLAKRR